MVASSPSMYMEWRRGLQTGKFPLGVRHFPRKIRLHSLILMPVIRLDISTLSSLRTRDLQQGSGRRSQLMVQCRVMRYSTTASTSHHRKLWVGTGGASAEVVAQLQAAAAANDEGSVKSIAASAVAAAQAAQAQAAQTQTQDPNAAGQTQGAQTQGAQTQPTDQNAAGQAQGTQTQQPAGQTQGAQTQ